MNKELALKRYNRRIKRALPDYKSEVEYEWVRPDASHCLIFPIYVAFPGVIPYYIINSAFWAAHSWIVNTNCKSEKWDIWFFIDSKLARDKQCQAMFKQAGFANRTLIMPDPPVGRANSHLLGKNLYATTFEHFNQYTRCHLVDTDMFFSSRERGKRFDVKTLENIGDDESLFMPYHCKFYSENTTSPAKHKYLDIKNESEARALYDKFKERYLGYIPRGVWEISGTWFVWNPQQLRQDFKDMVHKLTPDMSDDETQVNLYFQKTGVQPQCLKDVWPVEIYYSRFDLFNKTDQIHYLDHVTVELTDEEIETWNEYKASGPITEEHLHPRLGYEDPKIAEIWKQNIGLHDER